jgi:aryl-alcohol dehydrogenase-like predicted oxidoreductase
MISIDSLSLLAGARSVTRLGMGCWAAGGHGWGSVSDEESLSAIRQAADSGVTLFDTADVYGFGKSERLVRMALGGDATRFTIATKGGVAWDDAGRTRRDCSPEHLRRAVEASLERLGLDCIPLYYIHWPDGRTPVEEAVGALERMRQEGKILAIGLSNFSPADLERALQVARIHAVQVQYSLLCQDKARALFPVCGRHGVLLVAWGVLADGLLTGKFSAGMRFGADDHRSRSPDFQGEAFLANLERVEELRRLASARGLAPAHVALRWVLDSAEFTCALFGAKTAGQVQDNLRAAGWVLDAQEQGALKRIFVP